MLLYVKFFLLSLSFFSPLFALQFSVASYNVENFFDLKKDGTEYEEFIPNSFTWSQKNYLTKLQNTTKVINDIDADIIVLQEIENENLLLQIQKRTKYKYHYFNKKTKAAIGIGILSKFPFNNVQIIDPNPKGDFDRNIIYLRFTIDNKPFGIFVNHWKSKRSSESTRIKYALALSSFIEESKLDEDYIILGDLNSNYNEFITFKYDQTLNDTYNLTGINHVLNTIDKEKFITKENITQFTHLIHYNPWLELEENKRFSLDFKGEKGTPDNILISKQLFDNKNISYIHNSFGVSKPSYLVDNKGKIKRWNSKKNSGFSDHLPIIAHFYTSKDDKSSTKIVNQQLQNKKEAKQSNTNTISSLYNLTTIDTPIFLKDVIVTYQNEKLIVFKREDDRSIQFYNSDNLDLQLGSQYDLKILEIDNYFGVKEIRKIEIVRKTNTNIEFKKYYKNGMLHNLNDPKLQSEIIFNLKGTYNKGYLYYQNKTGMQKIKLYFNKELNKPKDGNYFILEYGILSSYRSKKQILINNYDQYRNYKPKFKSEVQFLS